MVWWKLLILLSIVLNFSNAAYDSSFAFLDVSNSQQSIKKTYCVNFQQFQSRNLPASPESSVTFAWWNGKSNETEVCEKNQKNFSGKLVPFTYHTNPAETVCSHRNVSTFMDFQMKTIRNYSTSAVLFLVEKGKKNAYGIRDYLFSQFYNPNINDSQKNPPVFYMYSTEFYNDFMLTFFGSDSIVMQFYRPNPFFFDFSIVIIWIIAFGCVTLGSIWAARTLNESSLEGYRKQTFTTLEEGASTTEETSPTENSNNDNSQTSSKMSECFSHCLSVTIAFAFVVGILLLSFFFRPAAVWFFNLFLVAMGAFCVYKCVYYLVGFALDDVELFSLSELNICWSEKELCRKKIGLISMIVAVFALALCVTWFIIRREYFAFYFLDFINICICVYAIKSSQIRSLRFITFLLIAFFIYDIVMVFGTRLLTPNGCSVMLQVVTGMDCTTRSKGEVYPVAPVDMNFPEKIPLLFYVPLLTDPMSSCYDVKIETEYRHVMLGLGDVIIPGYLIAYCFFVDAILKKRFGFGWISLIGYGTGLFATFLALRLMNTAQPALIYLVPFTLLPVIITSVVQKRFSQLWHGKFF